MADQPIVENPAMSDAPEQAIPRPVRATPRSTARVRPEALTSERKRSFFSTLDPYLLVVVGALLAIGLMMVYSTTFDWSYVTYGSETAVFMQHVRNMGIGFIAMAFMTIVDYRAWRKLAVPVLLLTIATLIAVLLFGDRKFGAQRSLVNGSFQPGEMAELATVMYMAAWLSSRKTQIRSLTYGLLPFATLVGIVAYLVVRQPDISTAATIAIVAGIMFFLAGADLVQLGVVGTIVIIAGFIWLTTSGPEYAQERLSSFVSSTSDVTQADYQVQQAIKAFWNGGWTGAGLGQGRQKYGNLPTPHTDSIFAVIGEELGIIGAMFVISLYIALVIRGFQIARRSIDNFGALLAAGIIIWIAFKALLNIAVMTGRIPTTGAPLPFISFGGSSLVVLMTGVGLLLSVARVRLRENQPKRVVPDRKKAAAPAQPPRANGNGRPRPAQRPPSMTK
jgi:cell division protein FtsW